MQSYVYLYTLNQSDLTPQNSGVKILHWQIYTVSTCGFSKEAAFVPLSYL